MHWSDQFFSRVIHVQAPEENKINNIRRQYKNNIDVKIN